MDETAQGCGMLVLTAITIFIIYVIYTLYVEFYDKALELMGADNVFIYTLLPIYSLIVGIIWMVKDNKIKF